MGGQHSRSAYAKFGGSRPKLIEAAVNCVIDDRTTPPPELELAWLCGEHHLPKQGGVMDQDYRQLRVMKSLANIFRVVSKFRSLEGERVNTDLTVNERLLLGNLRDMGLLKVGLKRG